MGEYDVLYGLGGAAVGIGSLAGLMYYVGSIPMHEPKEKGQAGGSRRTRRSRRHGTRKAY